MDDCQAQIVKDKTTGKFNVYCKGTRVSVQNTFLKATEKLMKYVRGQTT